MKSHQLFFTSMTPLNRGHIMGGGVHRSKKVDMTSYTAVRISKIKFWVGYKFFLNGYKKNLPLNCSWFLSIFQPKIDQNSAYVVCTRPTPYATLNIIREICVRICRYPQPPAQISKYWKILSYKNFFGLRNIHDLNLKYTWNFLLQSCTA